MEKTKANLHSIIALFLIAVVAQFVGGCIKVDEAETEVDRLTKQIADIRSDLSHEQRRTAKTRLNLGNAQRQNGSLAANLDAAKATVVRVQREFDEYRQRHMAAEVVLKEVKYRADRAALKEEQATRTEKQAAEYLQERDLLHKEFDYLRDQVNRNSKYEDQLSNANSHLAKCTQEKDVLIEQLNSARKLASRSKTLEVNLATTEKRLREVASIRPHYFLTLLESHEYLTDEDLLTWSDISLKWELPMRTREILTFTLPLSLYDPLGMVNLHCGEITIAADQCFVDLTKQIVHFKFPDIEKLKVVMEFSKNWNLSIEFGSPARLTTIQFGKFKLAGTRRGSVMVYSVQEVRLKGLPIARRSDDGKWSLITQ